MGKRSGSSGGSTTSVDSTPSMQYAKGFLGARWSASDPNGDPLVFTVEIRGTGETEWKLLKDKVTERYLSWDSTAYPDGEYRVRVTASDAPGNPPAEALTARLESSPFWIDNTPPKITALTAARAGGKLQVKWHAADALNNIVEGGVLAGWQRMEGGGSGDAPFGCAGTGLRAQSGCARRASIRSPCGWKTSTGIRRWRRR